MQQLTKRINALEKTSHAKKVFLLYPHQQGMTEKHRQIARQNAWQKYLSEGGDPHVGHVYTIPVRCFNPDSKVGIMPIKVSNLLTLKASSPS